MTHKQLIAKFKREQRKLRQISTDFSEGANQRYLAQVRKVNEIKNQIISMERKADEIL